MTNLSLRDSDTVFLYPSNKKIPLFITNPQTQIIPITSPNNKTLFPTSFITRGKNREGKIKEIIQRAFFKFSCKAISKSNNKIPQHITTAKSK